MATTADTNDPLGLVGQSILSGKYRVLRVLGAGGMGVVYEGIEDRLGRRCALKFVLQGIAENAEARKRFLREAQAGAGLEHPGIVRVYALEELDRRPFLVMELLKGRSLTDKLQQSGGILNWVEACDIVADAAEPLEYAHRKGIVHRDLKPENIFITDEHRAKILDFGIAKVTSELVRTRLTRPGQVLGTPVFMAREQVTSALEVDERTDVYALGVILYHSLTAGFPYTAPDWMGLVGKILTEEPHHILSFDPKPDIPPQLVDLVMQTIAPDRERRTPNMRALRNGLLVCTHNVPRLAAPHDLTRPSRIEDNSLSATPAVADSANVRQEQGRPTRAGHLKGDSAASLDGTARPRTLLLPDEPGGEIRDPVQGAPAEDVAFETPSKRSIDPARSTPGQQTRRRRALIALVAIGFTCAVLFAVVLRDVLRAKKFISADVVPSTPVAGADRSLDPDMKTASPASPTKSKAEIAAPADSPPSGDEATRLTRSAAPPLSSLPRAADESTTPERSAAPPTASSPSRSYLWVWSNPFALVSLDGRPLGETPRKRVPVTPGAHVVELLSGSGFKRTRRISVKPGQNTTIRVDWTKPEEESR